MTHTNVILKEYMFASLGSTSKFWEEEIDVAFVYIFLEKFPTFLIQILNNIYIAIERSMQLLNI